MQANSHNHAIPETVITAAETAGNAQLETLAAYATPLTADDRHNLLKTRPKTFQFVELAYTLAQENPQLTSKAFDIGRLYHRLERRPQSFGRGKQGTPTP
jgi:hypothetical protein